MNLDVKVMNNNSVHPEANSLQEYGLTKTQGWERAEVQRGASMTDAKHTGPTDCLERPLSRLYRRYAKFVARHPLWFVIVPSIVTLVTVPGIFLKETNIDVQYLYTPQHGRSRFEQQVVDEKWPVSDHKYFPNRMNSETRQSQVIVMPINQSESVLQAPYDEETYVLNLFITRQIAVFDGGTKYTYLDLCMRDYYGQCYVNQLMMSLYKLRQLEGFKDIYGPEAWDVTYPWIRNGGKKSYIASTLNDVQLYNGTNVIKKATCWLLIYQLRYEPASISRLSGLWEHEFEKAMLNYKAENLNISFLHSTSLSEESDKNAKVAIPLIGYCVIVMIGLVFVFGTVPLGLVGFPIGKSGTKIFLPVIDWVRSNHMLSLFGVLTAGMGSITAVGLLVYIGKYCSSIQFASVIYSMPFLTLSIGVDNMFLMVAAFKRTNPNNSIEERLGEAISEAGVSITITALTDAVSFAIGCFTTFPSVYLFCMFTATAIVITFVYQLTFLLALMAYCARLEADGRNNVIAINAIPSESADDVGTFDKIFNLGTVVSEGRMRPIQTSFSRHFFEEWYAPVLMNNIIRVFVLSWLGIYLIAGIYGCLNIRQGLEPKRILLRDSYAQRHYYNLLHHIWTYGTEVQVVVNNPPDFKKPGSVDEAHAIVSHFLDTEHTLGPESVQFWLDDYEEYARQSGKRNVLENNTVDTNFLFQDFLSQPQFVEWVNDLDLVNDTFGNRFGIKAYRFIIALKNYHQTELQRETLNLLRAIAARPELVNYNITTYYPLWHFGEQYNLVLPNTLQNMGIATATMIVISLLLIPHPVCAVWVTLSILSIDVGVVGFGAFWGLKIDIITMITIIMSIGFSVDFSAHVCYHYIISPAPTPEAKVQHSLGIVGWPIMQGAISTIVGISVISLTDAYLVQAFFRTVFLVITIGAVHGLVFIPVCLSLVVRGRCIKRKD